MGFRIEIKLLKCRGKREKEWAICAICFIFCHQFLLLIPSARMQHTECLLDLYRMPTCVILMRHLFLDDFRYATTKGTAIEFLAVA